MCIIWKTLVSCLFGFFKEEGNSGLCYSHVGQKHTHEFYFILFFFVFIDKLYSNVYIKMS